MSAIQQDQAKNSTTSTRFLKQQEELFKTQNEKIGKLMDLVSTFHKILHNAERRTGYEQREKTLWNTRSAIQKAQHEISGIREEQRHQFQALSNDDRRRLCEVVGLEHLERAWPTADEIDSESDVLAASDKHEESLDRGGVFGGTNMQEERSRGVKNPPQLYSNQTMISRKGHNSSQGHDEQADKQRRGTDTVKIPHKRVEALRGFATGQLRPHSSQPPLQQGPSSLYETKSQIGPQAYPNPWSDVAAIEEMLRQNQEKQRLLAADLKRSKEGILRMQEDIRSAEEAEGRRLPRVNVDVEAFLRAREVMECGISEEGDQEMGQGTEDS